jgi:undecaprenyl-diphosphatase
MMMLEVLQLDHALRLWVVTHRLDILTPVMWAVSVVGRGGIIWLAAGVAMTIARRMRPSDLAHLTLAILLASAAADYVLKPVVDRQRPFASALEVPVIGNRPKDASFPSGHAANAFAGAYVFSRILPAPGIVWWSIAVVIAYSRIYLGVHYPLDVIAGALVGWSCGFLAWTLPARLRALRPDD